MSYLGIDYGTKRIGVAFSSEDNSLAFPLKIVAAGNGAVGEIAAIARERGAGEIVVGESNDFAGKPNAVMKEIHAFAEALKAEGLISPTSLMRVIFIPVLGSVTDWHFPGSGKLEGAGKIGLVTCAKGTSSTSTAAPGSIWSRPRGRRASATS